ncbi:hypothetical protein PMAA_081850 [Talaromyces marneffei ATCC 18224]|uniref:Major facilitator superfamily (MFS) profile domain-containing protein n=1 Tax=Talaromyces marneffei (strain ATCC 18224 / CBS 334.59 / QM 7333) TaxID=441960 RepID=B6QFE1_TALMQ|nr:hypothetical protein PMAA_081850 [Talaromyces marneffei ATCC 18224]
MPADVSRPRRYNNHLRGRQIRLPSPNVFFSTACIVLAQAAGKGLSSDLTNIAAGRAAIFYFLAMYTLPIGHVHDPIHVQRITARSAATSWVFNFMIAEVTPVLFTNISCAAGCAVIYLFYPETTGRSWEEIDEIFLSLSRSRRHFLMLKAYEKGAEIGGEMT